MEARGRARDAHVGAQGQRQARTDGDSVHAGDHRLVAQQAQDHGKAADPAEIVHRRLGGRGHETVHVKQVGLGHVAAGISADDIQIALQPDLPAARPTPSGHGWAGA